MLCCRCYYFGRRLGINRTQNVSQDNGPHANCEGWCSLAWRAYNCICCMYASLCAKPLETKRNVDHLTESGDRRNKILIQWVTVEHEPVRGVRIIIGIQHTTLEQSLLLFYFNFFRFHGWGDRVDRQNLRCFGRVFQTSGRSGQFRVRSH
jgi:hypothetical protein